MPKDLETAITPPITAVAPNGLEFRKVKPAERVSIVAVSNDNTNMVRVQANRDNSIHKMLHRALKISDDDRRRLDQVIAGIPRENVAADPTSFNVATAATAPTSKVRRPAHAGVHPR